MIGDLYPVRGKQRDVSIHRGRWPGSGAPSNVTYPPSTRPDGGVICKGLSLTRTGAGLYTLQFLGASNVSQSVPFILSCWGQVISPAGTVYNVVTLTEVPATGICTLKFSVAGTPTDPIANETIEIELDLSSAGQP